MNTELITRVGKDQFALSHWDDFDELSSVVPMMARVYPNGLADVNHFHAAGGLGYMIARLLDAGFLHEDVNTILGAGLKGLERGQADLDYF